MSLAFVFPGQGSQKVGMGKALSDAFPESRAVFDEADAAAGFALSALCFLGPEEDLRLTTNTQPAILATSIAAYRALAARGVRASRVSRAAWARANCLLTLVRKCARSLLTARATGQSR